MTLQSGLESSVLEVRKKDGSAFQSSSLNHVWWLESCAIYGATVNQNLSSTKMQFYHDFRQTLESEMKRMKGAIENSKSKCLCWPIT